MRAYVAGADVQAARVHAGVFPMAFALARRAGDVAPYHGRVVGAGAMCAYVVGADVPAARVHVGVSDGVCVGAARRGGAGTS